MAIKVKRHEMIDITGVISSAGGNISETVSAEVEVVTDSEPWYRIVLDGEFDATQFTDDQLPTVIEVLQEAQKFLEEQRSGNETP